MSAVGWLALQLACAPSPSETDEGPPLDSSPGTADTAPTSDTAAATADTGLPPLTWRQREVLREDAFATFAGDWKDPNTLGLGASAAWLNVDDDAALEVVASGKYHVWIWELPEQGPTVVSSWDAEYFIPNNGNKSADVAELTGDGRDDLALSNAGLFIDSVVTIYPTPFSEDAFSSVFYEEDGLAPCIADYDGDGVADVLSIQGTVAHIYYGPFLAGESRYEPGSLVDIDQSTIGNVNALMCDKDVTGDGIVDLMSYDSDRSYTHFVKSPLPQGKQGRAREVYWLPHRTVTVPVVLDNWDGSGEQALVFASYAEGTKGDDGILVLPDFMNPDAEVQGRLLDTDVNWITSGDLNQDGITDLLAYGYNVGQILALHGPFIGDAVFESEVNAWNLPASSPGDLTIEDIVPGGPMEVMYGDKNEASLRIFEWPTLAPQ